MASVGRVTQNGAGALVELIDEKVGLAQFEIADLTDIAIGLRHRDCHRIEIEPEQTGGRGTLLRGCNKHRSRARSWLEQQLGIIGECPLGHYSSDRQRRKELAAGAAMVAG